MTQRQSELGPAGANQENSRSIFAAVNLIAWSGWRGAEEIRLATTVSLPPRAWASVTATGVEVLSHCPYDEALLGREV